MANVTVNDLIFMVGEVNIKLRSNENELETAKKQGQFLLKDLIDLGFYDKEGKRNDALIKSYIMGEFNSKTEKDIVQGLKDNIHELVPNSEQGT